MSRTLIAIPSFDHFAADFGMSLAALTGYSARAKLEFGLANHKGSVISDARNKLAEEALRVEATHILFLDSDMCFPPETLEILLDHQEEIVGAAYAKRVAPHTILSGAELGKAHLGLSEVEWLPLGCCLISTEVFKNMSRPWFSYETKPNFVQGEDLWFCRKARKMKMRVMRDNKLTLSIGHVGLKITRIGEMK